MSLRTTRATRSRTALTDVAEEEMRRLIALGAGSPDLAERVEIAGSGGVGAGAVLLPSGAALAVATRLLQKSAQLVQRDGEILVGRPDHRHGRALHGLGLGASRQIYPGRLTGEAARPRPRPAGRSGWV